MVETKKGGEDTLNLPIEEIAASTIECPLAFGHPENLITQRSVDLWLEKLGVYVQCNPQTSKFEEFVKDGIFDPQSLYLRYTTELRYLSKSMILACLKDFGREIVETYSPKDTAFYLPTNSQSAGLLYRSLLAMYPELAQFAKIVRGYHMEFEESPELKHLTKVRRSIFIDDWVLSGQQLAQNAEDSEEVGVLHTYHCVVSATGRRLLEGNPDIFQPRYRYVLPTPINAEDFRSQFSVYGWHKIPDYIPEYYAPGRRFSHLYSIFGATKSGGQHEHPRFITRNRQLIDHDGILQTEKNDLEEYSYY